MAGKRPDWVKAPAHLSENPAVPEPEALKEQIGYAGVDGLEPTRYGDWERKGICSDF